MSKEKLAKAWLVRWESNSKNEERLFEWCGIKNKVIDILSVRKNFDFIEKYAKDIYRIFRLSLSEKAFLANYAKGKQNEKKFFDVSVPVYTHYQSTLYGDLTSCIKRKGPDHEDCKRLSEKWKNYPEYITVGYNPCVDIRKVSDLVIYEDTNGNEVLECYEMVANGTKKKISFKNRLGI
ncbi:MAG: hypothetical protein WBD99_00070 [Thermodesulfobacteriota bacterium]